MITKSTRLRAVSLYQSGSARYENMGAGRHFASGEKLGRKPNPNPIKPAAFPPGFPRLVFSLQSRRAGSRDKLDRSTDWKGTASSL